MPGKPTTAAGYPPGQVARVRATCLYLTTKLGDLMPGRFYAHHRFLRILNAESAGQN